MGYCFERKSEAISKRLFLDGQALHLVDMQIVFL